MIVGDDTEVPRSTTFASPRPLNGHSINLLEVRLFLFTVAEVMNALVGPATIALVVDLFQTPPRFL